MLFNSLNFIIFFPIVLIIYWCIPIKLRRFWLLAASWFFCACFDLRCLFVLLGITLITYTGGLLISGGRTGRRAAFMIPVILSLLTLGTFKYLDFFLNNLRGLLSAVNVSLSFPSLSLFVPAGISFYTFKGIGYLSDVYKEKTKAEKNFVNYALFISFFPQLVAGPIDRADSLLTQIREDIRFDAGAVRRGALFMLFGYFEKLFVADRIAIITDRVYADHTAYSGAAIALATVCYGIQIYTDFAGYSYLSIGAAGILGFKVPDNFRQPYFAVNIKDFWSRWHISMSAWFRDHVYIPLGGNRKGRVRKYLNNMITFLLSGLWHGSAWNFVAWGGLHGLYHIVSGLTGQARKSLGDRLGIKEDTFSIRLFRTVMTFIMADYAWMYFRAGSLSTAVDMTRRILTDFRGYTLSYEFITDLGISGPSLNTIVTALIVVFLVDILREKKFGIIRHLDGQGIIFRWLCYIVPVLLVLLAAVQNLGVSTGDFIYFRF